MFLSIRAATASKTDTIPFKTLRTMMKVARAEFFAELVLASRAVTHPFDHAATV